MKPSMNALTVGEDVTVADHTCMLAEILKSTHHESPELSVQM